jgi:branched-chain amino acid transport system substrate-binding protein
MIAINTRIIAALVAAGLFFGTTSLGSAEEKPIRIGVLNDMSGPYADYQGPGSVLAAQMAVEDYGGKAAGKGWALPRPLPRYIRDELFA